MDTHASLITSAGGPKAVATALGVPLSTVIKWRQRDNIPARYWLQLVALFEREGLPVGLAEIAAARAEARA